MHLLKGERIKLERELRDSRLHRGPRLLVLVANEDLPVVCVPGYPLRIGHIVEDVLLDLRETDLIGEIDIAPPWSSLSFQNAHRYTFRFFTSNDGAILEDSRMPV